MAIYDLSGNALVTDEDAIESYFEEEVSDTVDKVRELMTEPCLTFALITDSHYNSMDTTVFPNAIKNIKAINKEIRLDGILCAGDVTDGNATKTVTKGLLADFMPLMRRTGLPVYFSAGNHDSNAYGSNSYYFTNTEMYKYYYSHSDNVVFADEDSYGVNFYKDFDEYNVRLISLDATNTDYGTTPHYRYPANTTTWFDTTLNATPSGYMVILLTHLSPYSEHNNGVAPENASTVISTIETWLDNGNTLISFIGHNHYDYAFTSPYLEVITNCNLFVDLDEDVVADGTGTLPEGAVQWAREYGTITEDCFDIIVIRPLSNAVDMIRFGAGEDRSFTY